MRSARRSNLLFGGDMKQDYVIYDGVRYNSGDTINILWYVNGNMNKRNYTGIFVDCDEKKDEYRFTVVRKPFV